MGIFGGLGESDFHSGCSVALAQRTYLGQFPRDEDGARRESRLIIPRREEIRIFVISPRLLFSSSSSPAHLHPFSCPGPGAGGRREGRRFGQGGRGGGDGGEFSFRRQRQAAATRARGGVLREVLR